MILRPPQHRRRLESCEAVPEAQHLVQILKIRGISFSQKPQKTWSKRFESSGPLLLRIAGWTGSHSDHRVKQSQPSASSAGFANQLLPKLLKFVVQNILNQISVHCASSHILAQRYKGIGWSLPLHHPSLMSPLEKKQKP